MSWKEDKQRADRFVPEITNILKDNAKYIVSIVIAPHVNDTMQATDYIIKVESGDVACRLRWWSRFTINKEWTIRSRRDTGAETELSKLKKGWARWYLYGWIIEEKLSSWMLIDLNIVRDVGLLNMPWQEKSNHDGTYFIIIPNTQLKRYGCIVSYKQMDSLLKIDEQKKVCNENMTKIFKSKPLFDFI